MKKYILLILVFILFLPLYGNEYINQTLDEQDILINSIESQIKNMNDVISSLQTDNESLSKQIKDITSLNEKMSSDLNGLKTNNENLKSALNSNKEDTSELINVLGDIYEEVNSLSKRRENTNIFVQTLIPITTILLVSSGVIMYSSMDDKTWGKVTMGIGGALFVGCEITWNCGRTIFRIW